MPIEIVVLTTPKETLAAFEKICSWGEQLFMAYAWASSAMGTAEHWRALPLQRVKRAVIGTRFAQTEPFVLQVLGQRHVLRVFADGDGVFHPKVMVVTKGEEARALVGSSNLTVGGFGTNTEVNVLLSGRSGDEPLRELKAFIDRQWSHQDAFEPDDEWLKEYSATYSRRPTPLTLPPRPKPSPPPNRVLNIDVDVDEHSPTSRLLGVGGSDAQLLLRLTGASTRKNLLVTCGGCRYVATTFTYSESHNHRWKMTVPKTKREASQMWHYVGGKGGGGFKFRGRYTFNPASRDLLELEPPPDWT